DDLKEKDFFKKQFLRDVNGHLKKVAQDYVCPQKGSADFAFVYIPSEGIYWFLVNEAFEVLRDFTKKGVQVVSPLTFSHKIELIKAGVHAKRLSEEAEKVKNALEGLSNAFNEIDEKWRIFYKTHLKNLDNKAEEVDRAYKRLREEFNRIRWS
ncbi:MAG TPA: DNA recombination protein RmuC, partial [Candidatus Desulfofervidus auxilii]|nr:DNA recombination protein RmuC [Candidatus Desulfofervidus auxilii]